MTMEDSGPTMTFTQEQLLAEAMEGRVSRRFVGLDDVDRMAPDELAEAARRVLARPQAAEFTPGSRPLSRRLLAAQWTLLLESLGLPEAPRSSNCARGAVTPSSWRSTRCSARGPRT